MRWEDLFTSNPNRWAQRFGWTLLELSRSLKKLLAPVDTLPGLAFAAAGPSFSSSVSAISASAEPPLTASSTHSINGHLQTDTNRSQLIRAFREMVRARKTDEKIIVLYKQNKCHFQIGCAGHEAVQVAAAHALRAGHDWSYPYYREMAYCAALGMTSREFLLNALNKPIDPNSGGRQMPMHYGHKDLRIVSQSSPTGTQFLQAVGAGLAVKFRGGDEVVYVSAGEGTCAQGDYHEALNWAARAKLPVIFCIQDNEFAISVHVSEQHAGGSVADLSQGYSGLEIVECDGLDYQKSLHVMQEAANRARRGDGPTLVVAKVVRLQSHSISDNQAKYRTPQEIQSDKEQDPIELIRAQILSSNAATAEELSAIESEIAALIDSDSEWAEAQDDADPDSWGDHLFVKDTPSEGVAEKSQADLRAAGAPEMFMVDALNKALDEELARNSEMVIYGQDVAYGKGGVFSVTQGLTAKYGKQRVFNSPLAESSIVGTAVGMATLGMKPVVEIQFGDYIWTAMMQIVNELATMNYRSAGAWTCPSVVRVAVGGYIHGALYHSQNIEATFAHIPGLHVVYPSNAADAKGLLKAAIRLPDPVLFLEHKGLYRQVYAKSFIGGENDLVPIGKARIARAGTDATIVTWGALVQKSLVAAEQLSREGLNVEVIDIRTIAPLDVETILTSVAKTNRVMIAQEDKLFAGFGGEIAAIIAQQAFEKLDAPVLRLAGKNIHIPHAPLLEDQVLPQTSEVVSVLRELLAY